MALALRMVAAGGLFLSHIILMKVLGVTGFGEYSLTIAWLQVLTAFGKLGMDNTSLRFVSEYATTGEVGKLRGFIRDSTSVVALASLTVMIGIMATAYFCRSMLGDRLANCLTVGAMMLPPITLRQIQEARLRGVGRLFESQVGTSIWPLLLFAMASIGWLGFPEGFSSTIATTLHLVSLFAVFLLVFYFHQRIPTLRNSSTSPESCRSIWASTAAAFLLAEMLISLKGRACMAVAGIMLDSKSAGLYGAMEKFADASLLASQSLAMVIAPQFASLFAARRYSEMRKLMRRGQIFTLSFTLPFTLAVIVFGDYLFALLGAEYREGRTLLLVLLTSTCIAVFSGPAVFVLQMTGRERTMLIITAACAATNILLSIVLMRFYGVLGLGMAQVATSLVWTIGVRWSVTKHPAWRAGLRDGEAIDCRNEDSECE